MKSYVKELRSSPFEKWVFILTESFLAGLGAFLGFAAFFGLILHWYSDFAFVTILGLAILKMTLSIRLLNALIENKK